MSNCVNKRDSLSPCNLYISGCFIVFLLSLWLFALNVLAVDVEIQRENYVPDYKTYHNMSRLVSELEGLEQSYRDVMRLNNDFLSKEGRPQLVLEVFNFTIPTAKRKKIVNVFFSYGEHAREFFPVETLLHFLKNITIGLDRTDPRSRSRAYSRWIVNNFHLYIVTMANPDGRHYLETHKNYCWRGNSGGVDLNRNFDWNFGGEGSSNDPNDGEYRGKHAFSEPETVVFRELVQAETFDIFVSFHSGIRHIYIPYADTKSKRSHEIPDNKEHMMALASKMSKASSARPFLYGQSYQLNGYTADGTSFDYMSGVHKVPFSLAIEMWQHNHHTGRSCFDEFNPRSEDLENELALVHPIYVKLLSFMHKWKREQSLHTVKEKRLSTFLIRRKKDNSQSEEELHNQQEPTNEVAKESNSNFYMYLFVIILSVAMAVLGLRHGICMVKRKRIVSIRSLSSTFSLLKSL